MKNRKFFALLLCFLLALQLLILPVMAEEAESEEEEEVLTEEEAPAEAEQEGVLLPPEINCKGAILVELNSDSTVFELNADERLYPASLTKIMTCLLALEHGNLSDVITVDGSLFADMDEDASAVGLQDGELLTLEELLYCVMVPSANDASLVVADHIGGSVEKFVDMMNQKAMYLGMDSTHFDNPNGVPNIRNYSCARDLVRLSRYAMGDSIFAQIDAVVGFEIFKNIINNLVIEVFAT